MNAHILYQSMNVWINGYKYVEYAEKKDRNGFRCGYVNGWTGVRTGGNGHTDVRTDLRSDWRGLK